LEPDGWAVAHRTGGPVGVADRGSRGRGVGVGREGTEGTARCWRLGNPGGGRNGAARSLRRVTARRSGRTGPSLPAG
jgi:hypothetical protein